MVPMRFLRRLRTDLSAGQNLEIYTTALLSLVLAVLGALGTVGSEVLSAAVLATLALLAGGMLVSRRQVAELTAEVRARGRGRSPPRTSSARTSPAWSSRCAPRRTSGSSE